MERKRKLRRLLNAAKKSEFWTDCEYKRSLTEYNIALRQAKESPGGDCEEIEQPPECARLQKILSRDGQTTINSPYLENGQYNKTEKETLEELLWVHFPGSNIITKPSSGWDGLELEFTKWNVCREDWAVSKGDHKF